MQRDTKAVEREREGYKNTKTLKSERERDEKGYKTIERGGWKRIQDSREREG